MRHTVVEVRLKNGARGLFINVPEATVMSYQFQFRAGNRYVKSKDIYETAHLMEHMAFGANSKYTSEDSYEAEFTKNGAYHNAFTSDISMVYVSECADFEWERILELQQLAIAEPKFNAEELASEKGNVRNELTGYQNKYTRLLWPKLSQALGEDVLLFDQRLKTINNITLNNIREHHRRTHTSRNLRFIIAGRLRGRQKQLKYMLENWRLPKGERFSMPEDTYMKAAPVLIRRKDATNLTFGWSMMLPRHLENAEDDAMDCLNHILTGTLHSKIFGKARKYGLLYDIFSSTNTSVMESSWDFGGEVNYDTANNLFDLIVSEMQNVLKGEISDSDIEAAKSYALGRYQMGAQTVGQISSFYSGRYFQDEYVEDYSKVPDLIRRTSKDDIIRLSREFISAGIWSLVGVGSCDKKDLTALSDKLEQLYQKEA